MWPLSPGYPDVSGSAVNGKTFDYIIVGGGTAGCVLARRLSADPGVTVLVLEKGHVRDNLLSRIPLLSQNFLGPFLQATYRWTEPVEGMGGKKAKMWTAEALGGAARVNGGLVTRGTPAGYDEWKEELGMDDWGWKSVEPFFKKSEKAVGKEDSAWRGHDGLLESRQFDQSYFKWYTYLEKAAYQLGLSVEKDANSPYVPLNSYCYIDMAVDAQGRRATAYRAFLNKDVALARQERLKVCTGVIASKLDIDGVAGVVKGVFFGPANSKNGGRAGGPSDFYAQARRDVIVCSGAMATPQLLMLSGLGPKDELNKHKITVIRDLPAVGANLCDHHSFPIALELPRKETMHCLESPFTFLWWFLMWFIYGTGILASNMTARSVFMHSRAIDEKTMTVSNKSGNRENAGGQKPKASSSVPNIEVMTISFNSLNIWIPRRSLMSLHSTIVQPFSKGSVTLASATDPTVPPRIDYGFLSDPRDHATMRLAVRFTMRLADEFRRNTGYPFPAKLTFAPGMDLSVLDALLSAPDRDPQLVPVQALLLFPTKPQEVQPGLTKEQARESEEASLSVSETSTLVAEQQEQLDEHSATSWSRVTDEEIDAYAQRVGQTALHFGCTCRMGRDSGEGVVDQRLRVFGLRNLRIADASVFPRLPSAHTMAPVIMVAERCAEFLKAERVERMEKC